MSLEAALRLTRPGFALAADVTAAAGEVTMLFGPSGCGKTTLLSAIAGLNEARGTCRLDGKVWQDSAARRVPAHRRGIGYVFQEASLFPHRSVAGNLDFAARRSGARDDVATVAARLGVSELLPRRPHQLSGGERQRVALARALLTRPRLLLLDEPLASLDTPARRALLPYLEQTARAARIPVLYVTHDLDELIRLGDRVQLMAAGRTGEAGPVADLLARIDAPLAARDDASAVLRGALVEAGDGYGLSTVRLRTQHLRLPEIGTPPGEHGVRLRVQARDVSLALERPRHTSLLNILAGRVEALAAEPARHTVRVQVAVDGQPVLARISTLSAERLALRPGMDLFVQIKAAALV